MSTSASNISHSITKIKKTFEFLLHLLSPEDHHEQAVKNSTSKQDYTNISFLQECLIG